MPDLNARGERLGGRTYRWLTDALVIGQREIAGQWRIATWTRDGAPEPVWAFGANMIAARGGRWLAFLAGRGVFGPGVEDPAAGLAGDLQWGCGVAADDGTIAVIPDYQNGQGLRLSSPAGELAIPDAQPAAAGVAVISATQAIWRDRATHTIRTIGTLPACATLPGPFYWPIAFNLGGQWWIAYHSDDEYGIVLHPFADATRGYRVARPPAYYLTGRKVDESQVELAWSTTPDDLGVEVRTIDVARDPLISLIAVPQPVPVPVPVPQPQPEPVPMPESLESLVQQVWTKHGGAPGGGNPLRAVILNEVAWTANGGKADGPWGLSKKNGGSHVEQPKTGIWVAHDILQHGPTRADGSATMFDVFNDSGVTWNPAEQHMDPSRVWVPAVQPDGVPTPPPQPPEPPQPPQPPQPPASPVDLTPVLARLDALTADVAELKVTVADLGQKPTPAPIINFPAYVGALGYRLRLTPEKEKREP